MSKACNIFLFTGQGAQYPGMAKALYRSESVFRKWMDELGAGVADRVPLSLTGFLFDGERGQRESGFDNMVDNILISHPALFCVQFSLAKTLIHYGIVPDFILGTSLGEVVALALAGAAPPDVMLDMLMDQALCLDRYCPRGAMMGITDRPERYHKDPVLRENVWLAGESSPRHFVVAGNRPGMDRVIGRLEETRTGYQPLPVRFAFHSPEVEPALERWQKRLARSAPNGLAEPGLPVISCCTGRVIRSLSFAHLAKIGRDPVCLPPALNTLEQDLGRLPGPDTRTVNLFDLGPGAWTSGFVRQNKIVKHPMKVYRVMTLFGDEAKNMDKIKGERGEHAAVP